MRRVVFVHYIGLNETLLRLYPIDFLAGAGVRCEYWDLSALFGHRKAAYELSRPYARAFKTWEELDAELARPETADALIVVGFAYEPATYKAWRRFSGSRARLGSVLSGLLPFERGGALRRLREDAVLLADPKKVGGFLLKRAALGLKKAGWVRGADVVFAAGDAAREAAGSSEIVPVNHFDYDDWLLHSAADSRPLPGRYGVYLDEFLPHHPDFAIVGIRRRIDPERYYAALDAFFRRLEERHGVEMVVAAHPKSDYAANPFRGRKIFRGETRRLARHCELAVTTYSTSTSYGVLARKPITFFTSDEIASRYRKIRLDLYPAQYAAALGRPLVNLDHPRAADADLPPVDETLYAAYERRFLVSRGSEGRPSRELWRDYLLSREPART